MLCLLLQAGCDITFKRKSAAPESVKITAEQSESIKQSKDSSSNKEKKSEKNLRRFSEHDIKLITVYYSSEINAQVLDDMLKHTWVNSKIDEKLTVGESIPADVQIIPLPLELEKILSPLTQYALRVQVGKRVIMMDVKSRRILDVIKIN